MMSLATMPPCLAAVPVSHTGSKSQCLLTMYVVKAFITSSNPSFILFCFTLSPLFCPLLFSLVPTEIVIGVLKILANSI